MKLKTIKQFSSYQLAAHGRREIVFAFIAACVLSSLICAPLSVLAQSQRQTRGQGQATAPTKEQTQTPQTQTPPVRSTLPPPPAPPPQKQDSPAPSSSETTAPQDLDPDDEVTINTELVNVLFSAQDKSRRFLTTLKQEDVRVLEDGVPQQVFTFQQQTDLPLTLAILMDKSLSQAATLDEQRLAANEFISSVLRPNKDEAAVVAFAGEAELEQGLTGNTRLIRRAVDSIKYVPPTGYDMNGYPLPGTPPIIGGNANLVMGTAIWYAVSATCNDVLREAPAQTRRAIILLTDGADSDQSIKLKEAVDVATKTETTIYSIGVASTFGGGYEIDKGALRKVSERTGGRAFFPKSVQELRDAFKQIETELRQQYLIAYSPKNKKRDATFRQVEIELVNPELKKQKLFLTYRQGYFAKDGNKPATAQTRKQ